MVSCRKHLVVVHYYYFLLLLIDKAKAKEHSEEGKEK